jgi:CheY-like chemotaxis protein
VLNDVFANLKKFMERSVKNLLVVEDDEIQRKIILDLIGEGDVRATTAGSGEEALQALKNEHYDCMVIDLGLPDMTGFQLLEQIKKESNLRNLPIIVYTGKDLSKKEETQLRKVAKTIIVKDVRSAERLLDETALFLHRVQANLPEPKRKMLENLHKGDAGLAGKKILVVDDDIRNIFAMTSVLERHNMQVVTAEDGREAISILENNNDVDAVLMDIMMPEMDGYETMRLVRQKQQFRQLPIIALTAKAMKQDREKCLEAGASDYIAKPVDIDRLLSLLRVWLHR